VATAPDVFAVVDTQRAIRRFRPDPVPDALVHRLIAAATRAPSARGAEPWAFVVVRDTATRAAIGAAYRAAWEAAEPVVAAGDADVRGAAHYPRMMRAVRHLAAHLGDVPVLIACGLDHERLGPIAAPGGGLAAPAAAYGSIFPAVQNLLLAARALGLGAALTTLHRGFEAQLGELLGLPATIEVVALVPVGWPVDRYGPTRRRPVEVVAHRDRWGTPFVVAAPGGTRVP
jgi:nitroreductase